MWPRFRLTPDEARYSSKYEDPGSSKVACLRRIYYGFLNTTPTIRQDNETFQIARRSRLFGMTASGDINLMEVQISDITGEQFTTDFIPLANLLGGTNFDPRSNENFSLGAFGPGGLTTGFVINPGSFSPLLFEPNIVLAPNQTLTIAGRPINPLITEPLHVSLCFHIWEFPGMPGSPV